MKINFLGIVVMFLTVYESINAADFNLNKGVLTIEAVSIPSTPCSISPCLKDQGKLYYAELKLISP